ncbi:MAG TPA: DUF2325 domain-containing protein [Nitrosomonas sp.]|jgi:hypothetical protein|nr:DUF2325 domain-containing protein [Nitrosomonas sp.]
MNESLMPALSITDLLSAGNQDLSQFPRSYFEILPTKRSKIWELKGANRCPVVGTCLSLDELVNFAQRYHFSASLNDTFSLHIEMIDRMATRNSASEAIQKHLDLKYQIFLARFKSAKTDAEVLNLWKKCFAHGDIAGALWAALTHKQVSNETRGNIYGDIHMHSHQMGAGQATNTRRLVQLEKDYAELEVVMALQKQRHVHVEAKLRRQFQEILAEIEHLRQAQKDMLALQARLEAIESGRAITEMGQRLMKLAVANERLQSSAKQVTFLEQALQIANGKIAELTHECDVLTAERDSLEILLQSSSVSNVPCNPSHFHNTSQIKNCCVICVGGHVTQFPKYRLLAEQLGIYLIHHDGGQNDALSRLPEMISRAAAAICPTDCISQAAYYRMKRLCKRNGKPCLLFKGNGISGFASALTQVFSDQVNLKGGVIELLKEVAD